MDDLERVSPPKIGGTLPHDENIRVFYSIAKPLKRIADHLEKQGFITPPKDGSAS